MPAGHLLSTAAEGEGQSLLAGSRGGATVGWGLQGNPNAALGRWDVAEKCFGKAAALAPEFAFAAGNHALALFQLDKTDEAIRQMRCPGLPARPLLHPHRYCSPAPPGTPYPPTKL